MLMAHDDIIISPDDHLILFVVEKKRIRDVEKLFENTSRLFLLKNALPDNSQDPRNTFSRF